MEWNLAACYTNLTIKNLVTQLEAAVQNAPPPSVIIIGAGIAGLSAGIYAQINGYQSSIYEMHNLPGGLMTAWKRKGYTIDGCIRWLTYSSPSYSGYKMWEDIGLVQGRTMFDPEIFSRVEGKEGQALNLYSDANRLEEHMLELAPEDRKPIHELCSAVRAFARVDPPSEIESFTDFLKAVRTAPKLLAALPYLPKWSRMTMLDMSAKFSNPFLRETLHDMWYPSMSAIGLLFTLAMLHNRGAGYPLGGSMPMARGVEKRYCELGGEIFYDSRVDKILVEEDRAVGIRLTDGHEVRADTVISAADGHSTIFKMLGGQFVDETVSQPYEKGHIFPPILMIGLGVDRQTTEPYGLTGGISLALDEPFDVAGETVQQLDMMIYNFDPSLAPPGKTVLTTMINTSYTYWKDLHGEPERYEAEKQRVALEVIRRLDRRFPGLAEKVEMADVATPVTFERYTGNWQGSFEGWLPSPEALAKPMAKTLPGLRNFYMVRQWVSPGGGLPSGVMTGRQIVKMLCKRDGKKFHNERKGS